jgi:hypothetical protein
VKALILGDVHGDWTAMNITIAKAMSKHPDITHIFQVGDFADGWPNKYPGEQYNMFKYDKRRFDKTPDIIIDWCDGNHDNHPLLREHGGSGNKWTRYHARGDIMEIPHPWGLDPFRIMWFGGATSYDQQYRTEGINWWPEEAITYAETEKALRDSGPIHAVISHDHPISVPYSDERYKHSMTSDISRGDRQCLQAIMDKYNPPFWFFGHHHTKGDGVTNNTQWICCPIIDTLMYVIWDGEKVELSWK